MVFSITILMDYAYWSNLYEEEKEQATQDLEDQFTPMDGPWYECQGPNYTQVREDVKQILNRKNWTNAKSLLIVDTITEIIPDTRNDFGSFRGYATFGVPLEIAKEVETNINKKYKRILAVNRAYSILRKKFIPIIHHWLYKPDGTRQKIVSENTNVGKDLTDE